MELEALKQMLSSLDINPDEIKDERYAKAFHILFFIIEKQNEEIEFLKAENQKLRDEINLLKGEQTKPKYPLQIVRIKAVTYFQPQQKNNSCSSFLYHILELKKWNSKL